MMADDQTRLTQYKNAISELDELNGLVETETIKDEKRIARHLQATPSVPPSVPDAAEEIHSEIICSPWNVSLDRWWQRNPEWESHGDNETHTCFQKITDPKRVAFLEELYESQYHGRDCSHMRTRHNIGVGYSAAIVSTRAFWRTRMIALLLNGCHCIHS